MSNKTVIGLIEKIITSTPNTVRAVFAILLVIAALVAGLWLLKANLTAGPISIVGRDAAATPVCRSGTPGTPAGGHCGP